jgi:outer membrane protein OmpA-like peptidoglycan-associated protein
LSREAELIQLHEEWVEKRESVATIARDQNILLEVIRQKTLQIPLISPDPSLEVNRILLMLSALPDTFVQQISKVLNEKLSALQHPDSLLAGKTEREDLLSPEAEKQLNQQLVFDLKTYIDAHNRQELLEQQQGLLELAVKEGTESQITMERQVSRKTKEEGRTTPLQNVNPSRADKAQPFEQLFLTCPKIPVQAGSKMILQSIYFEENTAVLKSSAENELQRLIDFLKKNATIVLEIGVHTHTQLAHAFADPISVRRAKAVVDYIAEHGIDRNRMLAAGYGKKQPLVLPDTDPEQQKINQRIEIRILK